VYRVDVALMRPGKSKMDFSSHIDCSRGNRPVVGSSAPAAIQKETVTYKDGETAMKD
jgi:hypothetical protein